MTDTTIPNEDSVAETLRAVLIGSMKQKSVRVRRAAGYTRVSSVMQLEDGTSIEDQETRIGEYIHEQGWDEVGVISDPAQSGRSGNRPGFRRLQRLVRRRRVDVVVVDRIDRISRNLFTLLNFIKQLNDCGVRLVSLRERIDFSTTWGQLVLYILGALAEFYSSVLSQEIRLQRYYAAKAGRLTGAFRLGYCRGNCASCTDPNGPDYCPRFGCPDAGDGKIRIAHPVESHAVRLMFEWYGAGQYSDDDVARRLNAEVFTLPDGTEVHFRTKGRPGICEPQAFDRDAVRAILTNPIYTGVVTYAGSDAQGNKRRKPVEFFPGQHPAIVDLALFRRVQAIRRNRYRRSQSINSPTRTYPLSGIVFCADAGSPMRGISTSGGKYRYYSDKLCRQRLTKDEWHQPNVKADWLEEQVQALVTQMDLPPEWRQRVLTYLVYEDGTAEMEQEKFLIRERLRRAKELYEEGDYTREHYERVRAACQRDLAALAPTNTPTGQEATAILDDLPALWEVLSDEEKNGLYRTLLSGIYVRGKVLDRIEPRQPFRELLTQSAARLDREASDDAAECVWSEIVEAQSASSSLLDYTDVECGVRKQNGNTMDAFSGEGYAYQPGLHGDGTVPCYHPG
jgi:DNA invertase Pin-like site-specific DNA recombinase